MRMLREYAESIVQCQYLEYEGNNIKLFDNKILLYKDLLMTISTLKSAEKNFAFI